MEIETVFSSSRTSIDDLFILCERESPKAPVSLLTDCVKTHTHSVHQQIEGKQLSHGIEMVVVSEI